MLTNQLAAAKAKRAVLSQQAAEGDTVAPGDGRVLAVPVTLGSVVLPGETVATIAGGGYFLRLSLPERHAAEIAEGGTVLVGERVLSPMRRPAAPIRPRRARASWSRSIPRSGRPRPRRCRGRGPRRLFRRRAHAGLGPGRPAHVLAVPPAAVTTRHGVDYVRLAASTEAPVDVAVILGETFAA